MYTHAAARTEADRIHALIEAAESEIEELENGYHEPNPDDLERLGRQIERLERELDALSAADADPAAHGFGWAGDLDPRDTYYA